MRALVPVAAGDDKACVRALLGSLVRLALPPRCPGCGATVEADHRFCADCWRALVFLEADAVEDGTEPPVHAAVGYGPIARRVALALKYGGRSGHAVTCARAMVRVVPPGLDLLVPVPLHRRRIWTRGYNQAWLIARALAREANLPVAHALTRSRPTPVLRGMGPSARARAVAGAFVAEEGAVRGRSVGLVDDIYTTGATARACADALAAAGAADVVVICWARVMREDEALD